MDKMFLYLYKGNNKESKRRNLMIGKLVSNVVKKAVNTVPIKTVGRTIVSKGNGQKRVIVEGFSGRNLEPESYFQLVNQKNFLNLRPIVGGFTGKNSAKVMTGMPGRGFVRFFPNFRLPRMSRHIVHDVNSSRVEIKGFTNEAAQAAPSIKKISSTSNQAPKKIELAQERVVVQGFGGNSATPVYKTVEQNNPKPRTVIKGFLG